jgi:uncharacterized protein (TIGR02145 family)
MKSFLLLLSILFVVITHSQEIITDVSGNTYKTVKIGSQIWMAENFNVTSFRNGDPIQKVSNYEEWLDANNKEKPAWCFYGFDENNALYGKLYNWFAVNDSRGLAPKGWHIPSDTEWTNIINYFGDSEKASYVLKSTNGWYNIVGKDCSGNNNSGLNIIPSGALYADGNFVSLREEAYFWSSTQEDDVTAWYFYLNDKTSRAWNFHYAHLSLRCVKD